jgi:EAL domain-containing protein (putative c-di-GMP-specific phosphodiesterase class I)
METADALLVIVTERCDKSMEEAEQAPLVEDTKDDFIGVYQKVRSALDPARAYSVSMHDERGEPDWLSESALGPDEHQAVRDALDLFAAEPARAVVFRDLGNARSTITLRVASYERELLGAIMIVLDTRSAKQYADDVNELLSQTMQRALHQYASIRRTQRDMEAASSATAGPAPQIRRRGEDVHPEIDQLNASLRSNPIELHVQRLVPLRADSKRRRYEVLLRSKAAFMQNAAPKTMLKTAIANGLGSMIDRRVVAELIGWLSRHPAVWQVHGLSFSVNLTRTSLHDVNFIKFVDLCITKAALPKDTIGFEIDIPTALRARDRMPDLAAALHALGCPLILDDFISHSECFALMQLPGVSMLKMAPEVTAKSRTDRIAKASITALVQRSRAQNIQTVAKRTKSRADEQWLNDLGFDYVQSHAFSLPVTISSLVKRYGSSSAQT